MKDLSARLREIVRRESASPRVVPGSGVLPPLPSGELTYVPGIGPEITHADVAECLGGIAVDRDGACLVIERRYEADRSHGAHRLEACVPSSRSPIHLFDPRMQAVPDWADRPVFFDIETTGLSGGAGTVAFLAGCGWFDHTGDFVVRQFFLARPAGERPMLAAVGEIIGDASTIVTYNGRTFDMPFMETRWAFHRSASPAGDLPHVDLLPAARRLWGRRRPVVPTGEEGCSLGAIERRVLGFHRDSDVPGFEIPARYFHFLRSGDASAIEGVLEHNRHDIVSLAVVMAHALRLAEGGPSACREAGEQLGLGRLYERAGNADAAIAAYRQASTSAVDAETSTAALERAALLLRRQRRYDEAAEAWQGILNASQGGLRSLSAIERRAAEALAIHHEHRVRDLSAACRYARVLDGAAGGRPVDVARRLERLDRKMARTHTPRHRKLDEESELGKG